MKPARPKVSVDPRAWIVRHGAMHLHGVFTPVADLAVQRGAAVVVQTERGTELGTALCPATAAAVEQIPDPTEGELLRLATPADQAKAQEHQARRRQDYDDAARLILQHHLPMQLVDVEWLLGEERVIFYFLAEQRVDFRELVKSMARHFRKRIELRQIGVRDEARLLADYGDCGKPVCCNTHMLAMPPVTMPMAKLQKATLDPAKISGRCGRLKCCLRFEYEAYLELAQKLPAVGSTVQTRRGRGRVVEQEILAQRLLVELEDGRRLTLPLAEIDAVLHNPRSGQSARPTPTPPASPLPDDSTEPDDR
ncbi:MAG: regulatory iron-sulfur-containing complex subunit RicT [Thermogemmata sp.]